MAKKKKQPNHYIYQQPKPEEKDLIPELIVLVGLSGSGKSTYAKKLSQWIDCNHKPYIVLSSDEIRKEVTGDENNQEQNEEVFKILHRRLKENIRLKNSVVIDATNLKLKNRRAILNCIKKVPCHKKALIFAVPFSDCVKRQTERERKVPTEVIKRQEMSFEIPFYEEGWEEIAIINRTGHDKVTGQYMPVKSMKDTDFFKEQIGFDQKTKHHLYTLDEHSIRVAEAIKKYTPNYKMLHPENFNKEVTEDELWNYFKYSMALLEQVAYIHDYGKLFVGIPKDDGSGDYKYFNHHNVSAYEIMVQHYKTGIKDIRYLIDFLFYINYHMLPFFISTPKAEKKWRDIFGDWKYDCLQIFNECDIIGSGTRKERVGVN